MVANTKLLSFPCHQDNHGCLVPVETYQDIPFGVKRIYYIYGVDADARRGFHSHKDLEQALICIHGSVTIQVKTPYQSEDVILNNPTKALYIGPMVWREMYNFSPDAVLLVLASEHYTPSDYIRNYDEYVLKAEAFFADNRKEEESNASSVCHF